MDTNTTNSMRIALTNRHIRIKIRSIRMSFVDLDYILIFIVLLNQWLEQNAISFYVFN